MVGPLRAVVVLVVVAACYQPTITTGAPCASSSECPRDQACVGNVCGGALDAAVAEVDAPDAVTDAPATVRIVIGSERSQLRDTTLDGNQPNIAKGGEEHGSVDDDETTLVWFELADVPETMIVVSAMLTVTTADEAAVSGGTITIHRMREAWVEAEASWLARRSGQPWTAIGAGPPARDVTPIASLAPDAVAMTYAVALPTSLVVEWLAEPASNHGLAIVRGTVTEHVHLRTRESDAGSTLILDVRAP